MADLMQFDLVSPERLLASVNAISVQIPGTEGDLTAMPGHMPLITTIRPGILTITSAEGIHQFFVTGGFAEVGENVTILAEKAVPREEISQEEFSAMVADAESTYKKAQDNFENEPGPIDEAAKMLSDMVAAGNEIGLTAHR